MTDCACRGEWKGGGHCRSCCTTFASDSAFDDHRAGPFTARYCLPVSPSDVWRLTGRGWTNSPPLSSEALKSLRRGRDE